MNKEEVVTLMTSSQTETEWNANADEVKRRCNGYPDWWYQVIVLSGVAQRTTALWGGDAEIRVHTA